MKKQNLFKLLSLFLVTSAALSQVQKAQTLQVGNTSTNTQSASAALQIDSTTRGLLPPRMTQALRNAIVSPVAGLMIWCTDCGTYGETQVYDGTTWKKLSGSAATFCGAYVAAGVWKKFMCHNLGADTSLDPHVPVINIHGNYYQWGKKDPVANAYTPAAAIAGWTTASAVDNSWGTAAGDNFKNPTNDPCPIGFRVPTKTQWDGVIANNTITRTDTGNWSDSATNYAAAISFGTSTIKTLTLPAAGYRFYYDGSLYYRGSIGFYWSSTEIGTNAWFLYFNNSSADTSFYTRTYGFSVRCVSE